MAEIETHRQWKPNRSDGEEHAGHDDHCDEHVDRGSPPHGAASQDAHFQFEADAEQEQIHADLGESLDSSGGFEPDGVEHETGDEVPDERRKAQA